MFQEIKEYKELKQFTKDKNATPDEDVRLIQAYLGFTGSTFGGSTNMMETLINIGVMVEGVLAHKRFYRGRGLEILSDIFEIVQRE